MKMRKLLALLLCLFMLIGCTPNADPVAPPNGNGNDSECQSGEINISINDDVGKDYLNKIKNFTVRPKDKNKTVDNAEFEAFLDSIFVDTLEESYLTMHGQVVDYKSLNLTKPEPKWAELDFNSNESEQYAKQLETLLS